MTRAALQLYSSTAPSEVRIFKTGSFNKVFFIQFGTIAVVARVPFDVPAARDPIRLGSQIATLDFLRIHKPTVPIPRVLAAAPDNQNLSRAPFIISEFCRGTPLTIQEWYDDMSNASRDRAIDLLADAWVKITAPVSLNTIGSIVQNASNLPHGMRPSRDDAQSSGFRVIPMIPQFPDEWTGVLDPSTERHSGPRSIAEHWSPLLEAQRHQIGVTFAGKDPSFVVWDDRVTKHTLEKLWQCFQAMQELTCIAASLDPLARTPAMALMHSDYSCWKNILFSADRRSIEGIVDWDDAVVLPRDLTAIYPDEMTDQAGEWRSDPPDVFSIPPGTLYEDEGSWETAIQETQQRRTFREAVGRRDPQLEALYTDRRAKLRRRVHYLVRYGWYTWLSNDHWVLSEGLEEARTLARGRK
ncbi:uncharacterized protein B0H18DRAFT_104941 [Fomitopsis serialis]|uniref:uncharacterized protein n=1 Tax=Fomitopsis serialis TaxID=139415 RepID=UPI0020085E4E|nr:uncharacterized protein B0H18DRAFT_104941 [Neoantrodia serialis]KAH9931340.1 hypothetical protein B0H18DRAFT_104941 [Neoantrodia serialis]